MTAEIGHFALILSLCVAVAQAYIGLATTHTQNTAQVMWRGSLLQAVLIIIAFFCLMWGFVQSDFSIALVQGHSHLAKPMLYKISAVWGNHEGSLLLWVLIVALYGAVFAFLHKHLPSAFYIRVLMVQAIINIAFLVFMLLTSNPFARLAPPPFEGQGLNPVLQDPALAAHPPLLYLGYVGFSLVFAIAIAVLLDKDKAKIQWAKLMRLWTMTAWIFLTLGIALGSFWAYYELGWGGFWFWDPVENASLMPWLSATALLHSLMASTRRDLFNGWVLLLAILTFCLSLSGTFLVRSGVLTSVHAFANDPARGLFILLILAGFAIWGLALFARHLPRAPEDSSFALISRESTLLIQNIGLSVATATVFIGTIYPLVLDALGGGKISVGAPYFNSVFAPLIIPFLLLIPFAPLMGWGKGDVAAAVKRLAGAAVFSVLAVLVIYFMRPTPPLALAVIGAALWVVAASSNAWRQKIQKLGWQGISAPAHLSHIGFGVLIAAAVAASVWRSETIIVAEQGQIVSIAHYALRYDGVKNIAGDNYQSEEGQLVFVNGARQGQILKPERRFYEAEQNTTTEAALAHDISGTLYAVIGEREGEKQILRLWYHPFVNFIWFGAIIMALGGCSALRKQLKK